MPEDDNTPSSDDNAPSDAPDVSALEASLATATKKQAIEREHRINAEKKHEAVLAKLKEVEAAIEAKEREAKEKAAVDGNDFDGFKKNFHDQKEKDMAELRAELEAKNADLSKRLESVTLGATIDRLATESFGDHADVLRHVYADQLKMHMADDGSTKPIVVDAQGVPRDIDLDKLKLEVESREKLMPFLVGNKASGGGATGSSAINSGGATNKTAAELSEKERLGLHKSNPDAFHAKFGGRRTN